MSEICHKVGLKISRVKLETADGGIIKEIAGSPEIKGVRGTDRRKYLIDLMRL